MQKNTLKIEIKKPVTVAFEYTTSPKNTPKWIPSVSKEWIKTKKIGIGTVYFQKTKNGKRNAIVVTGFVKNRQLDFHAVNGTYTCSYRYKKTGNGTLLRYSEENGVNGKLTEPMKPKNLKTLKRLIEDHDRNRF